MSASKNLKNERHKKILPSLNSVREDKTTLWRPIFLHVRNACTAVSGQATTVQDLRKVKMEAEKYLVTRECISQRAVGRKCECLRVDSEAGER